jgi:hypothetical protein
MGFVRDRPRLSDQYVVSSSENPHPMEEQRAGKGVQRTGKGAQRTGGVELVRRLDLLLNASAGDVQGHGEPELLQSADIVALQPLGVQLVKVVGPAFVVGHVIPEHVVDRHQQTLGHR